MFMPAIGNHLKETPSPYKANIDDFLSHCAFLEQFLQEDAVRRLKQLSDGELNYYQFCNLPLPDPVSPTPSHFSDIGLKENYCSEGTLGAIAAHLGNIFGYREQNGFVIHDIFPLQDQEFSNTGSSSRRSLAFHSDGASHPVITPDFLLLYCIRPDEQVCNHIIELPQLLVSLPDTVIHMLKQPCFRHLVDEELQVVDKDNFIMQPVICEEQGRLIIKYDYDLTFGTDIHSCQALEILNQQITNHTTRLDNHANSLLVINNKTCLHGRSAFIPRYDGSDRWIQSAFVSRCNIRNGAVIHTQ